MNEESRPFGMEEYTDQQIKDRMFNNICQTLFDTYKKKNADYGDSFSRIFKKRGMSYALDHLEEKVYRIEALQAKDNDVKDETYVDSLKDLANYAILTLIELELNKK